MYNYFMIIGYCEDYSDGKIKIKVKRDFSDGEYIITINVGCYKMLDVTPPLNRKISVKGRILAHANGELELIGEKIFFL